jgi:hypothetical protein
MHIAENILNFTIDKIYVPESEATTQCNYPDNVCPAGKQAVDLFPGKESARNSHRDNVIRLRWWKARRELILIDVLD